MEGTAPGALHTKLEFHLNGCGKEMGFTGNVPVLALDSLGAVFEKRAQPLMPELEGLAAMPTSPQAHPRFQQVMICH